MVTVFPIFHYRLNPGFAHRAMTDGLPTIPEEATSGEAVWYLFSARCSRQSMRMKNGENAGHFRAEPDGDDVWGLSHGGEALHLTSEGRLLVGEILLLEASLMFHRSIDTDRAAAMAVTNSDRMQKSGGRSMVRDMNSMARRNNLAGSKWQGSAARVAANRRPAVEAGRTS